MLPSAATSGSNDNAIVGIGRLGGVNGGRDLPRGVAAGAAEECSHNWRISNWRSFSKLTIVSAHCPCSRNLVTEGKVVGKSTSTTLTRALKPLTVLRIAC